MIFTSTVQFGNTSHSLLQFTMGVIVPYTVKTKVGRAHHIVSANTPIAHLVCYGRQNGGLYPPLFLQCSIRDRFTTAIFDKSYRDGFKFHSYVSAFNKQHS